MRELVDLEPLEQQAEGAPADLAPQRAFIYFNSFVSDDPECPMPGEFVPSGNFRDVRAPY